VLLSNISAEKGGWGRVAKVRRQMRERGVTKIGFSWVDFGASTGKASAHGGDIQSGRGVRLGDEAFEELFLHGKDKCFLMSQNSEEMQQFTSLCSGWVHATK
jgi:hypothetical protein